MKNKMTNTRLARSASLFGLAAVLFLGFASASNSAQGAPDQRRGDPIEGVWDSQITITDCVSGTVLANFRGLGSLIRGGSNIQTNNLPPGSGSPAFGRWEKLSQGHYSATFRFFAFANGVFSGTQRVTRDIQLDPGGDTFTSVLSTEFYDPNGNLIATGCGTEVATRVE
jgi:hypothetical protein